MYQHDSVEEKKAAEAFARAMEDRGAWFYLLLKEAKDLGYNYREIAERAIMKFGKIKGKKMGEVKSAGDFVKALSKGPVVGALKMEVVECRDDEGVIKFNYCPLVESWKKLGCSDEEVRELCQLAMIGDYGMISCFPQLKLEFKQLLSHGEECCEMIVTRK